MSLSTLPDELLTMIDQDCGQDERHSLTLVNSRLYDFFNPILYRNNILDDGPTETCTFWAAREGCLRTLKLAVAYGADINDKGAPNDPDRYMYRHNRSRRKYEDLKLNFASPLHIAIYRGHTHIVEWLLDNGAVLNTPSRELCNCVLRPEPASWYPLHTAICRRDYDTACLLISRGAVLSSFTTSALYCAVRRGCMPVVEALAQRPRFNANEMLQGTTALHHASHCGNGRIASDMVHILVDRGARVNTAVSGVTPLDLAVRRRHFGVVSALIDRGADTSNLVNSKFDCGGILHWFLDSGYSGYWAVEITHHSELVQVDVMTCIEEDRAVLVSKLIALGAGLEVKGSGNRCKGTPLFFAAAYAMDADCVKHLLDAGARIDATPTCRGEKRNTLLYGIFSRIDPRNILPRDLRRLKDAVGVLLQHGARLDSLDGAKSALEYVCQPELHGTELLQYMAQHISASNTSLEHIEEVARRCNYGDEHKVAVVLKEMHESVRKSAGKKAGMDEN
ncbi:hypothetical protein G7Z17_g4285 [Cylindrodendrum hubeiense]|uniref:Ankyrin repeat protein n=1 Tax=Cylindrodendrum hubeiense TaxID=595255 RepID=A0A9P5LIG8_9HYPO|nr:hypothetical protein G7Z17_g4285 [Cylindrodendrum hubeiense]